MSAPAEFKTQYRGCATACNFMQDSEEDAWAPWLEQVVEGEAEVPQQEEEGRVEEDESDSSRSSSPANGRVSHF